MSTDAHIADVVIAGGGLAGLSLSIQLAKQGHAVVLLEKEHYPFHRVCGEYISLESWDFLCSLGIDLPSMHLPVIKQLQVSSAKGKLLQRKLPLGGFGISRHLLDHQLAIIAKEAGVKVEEGTKVNDILFVNDSFIVHTNDRIYKASIVCGCFGKRSNIDVKMKRTFVAAAKNRLNNYIGVKYHVRTNFPIDTIALHNFQHGYCGISKVEGDVYNLCYLTTAAVLQRAGGNIKEMEKQELCKNPHLKKIFNESEILFTEPVTISQISFDKKSQVEDHILMVGDAAGMITPLCGNGMSMALHGSKLAAEQVHLFLSGKISREQMEKQYGDQWKKFFGARLRMGRRLQRLMSSSMLSNIFISTVKPFPFILDGLIKKTHGQPF